LPNVKIRGDSGPLFDAVPFDDNLVTRIPADTLPFADGNAANYAYPVMLPGHRAGAANQADYSAGVPGARDRVLLSAPCQRPLSEDVNVRNGSFAPIRTDTLTGGCAQCSGHSVARLDLP
jgi:hypothetical protein